MGPRAHLEDRRIPAVTAGPITEEHLSVLLWVRTGTATVTTGDSAYHLSAGQAIWIPPGVQHCTRTDEGTLVLPIFLRSVALQGRLAAVRVISVPHGWDDWLVFQFDFNRYHSAGTHSGTSALLALVADLSTLDEDPAGGGGAPPLPMPTSREARAVAHTLLQAPGSPCQAEDLAAQENLSVRTLQRQFRIETGMTFSEWRTRARVVVAATHLGKGRDVGWTGRRVGYATPAGFTRAFRRYFGVAPREYAARTRTRPCGESVARPGSQLVALGAEKRREPPPIPPRQVWTWVYDWHVLWWAYRGTAQLTVGTRAFTLQQGEAIWLPAGLAASVDLAEGSILLPLGNRHGGRDLGVDELTTFRLPAEAETALLHTVLAEYTLFRPDHDHDRLADHLFRAQFLPVRQNETANGLTGAVATIARALRREPANPRTLADWALHLRLPPQQLGREFITQTGSSFPRWRAHLRMSLARELLMYGDPPHEISRFLGYATPGAFGKVFTTTHGMSPRTYQRHVSGTSA